MKLRTAAIILIVAAGLSLLASLINMTHLIERGYSSRVIYGILNIFYLATPVALVILGIALMGNKSNLINSTQGAPVQTQAETAPIPSVGDWLIIFLLMLIPLVNIILIIIWATDKNNMVRKNYAVATLIWALIVGVISLLLFATVLSSVF